MALVLAAATTSACAEMSGIVIAGGEIDGGIEGADVYVAVPNRAEPAEGRACQAAKTYVDLINEGRFTEVADLFSDDAVILDPARRRLRGHSEILDFYLNAIGDMRPEIIDVAYVGDDTDCMVELAAKRPVRDEMRYTLVSVDHFTLGSDGKVVRMVAFARPQRTE